MSTFLKKIPSTKYPSWSPSQSYPCFLHPAILSLHASLHRKTVPTSCLGNRKHLFNRLKTAYLTQDALDTSRTTAATYRRRKSRDDATAVNYDVKTVSSLFIKIYRLWCVFVSKPAIQISRVQTGMMRAETSPNASRICNKSLRFDCSSSSVCHAICDLVGDF
jgi:hypothetical protein